MSTTVYLAHGVCLHAEAVRRGGGIMTGAATRLDRALDAIGRGEGDWHDAVTTFWTQFELGWSVIIRATWRTGTTVVAAWRTEAEGYAVPLGVASQHTEPVHAPFIVTPEGAAVSVAIREYRDIRYFCRTPVNSVFSALCDTWGPGLIVPRDRADAGRCRFLAYVLPAATPIIAQPHHNGVDIDGE